MSGRLKGRFYRGFEAGFKTWHEISFRESTAKVGREEWYLLLIESKT